MADFDVKAFVAENVVERQERLRNWPRYWAELYGHGATVFMRHAVQGTGGGWTDQEAYEHARHAAHYGRVALNA